MWYNRCIQREKRLAVLLHLANYRFTFFLDSKLSDFHRSSLLSFVGDGLGVWLLSAFP